MPAILNFRPHRGGTTLRGFFDLRVSDPDLLIRNFMIHEKNGSRWIAAPGVPQLNKDGTVKTGRNGKPEYTQIISGADPQAWKQLTDRVIAALVESHPDAFNMAGGRS
jgi:hypothetical protein